MRRIRHRSPRHPVSARLTLAYVPIWPLGTFLVMPRLVCDDPDGDADQYRAVRVDMDKGQAAFHYLVAVVLHLAVVAAACVWSAFR